MNSDLNAGRGEAAARDPVRALRLGLPDVRADLPADDGLGAVVAFTAGADIRPAAAIAYGDVLAAWRNYLATRNNGRPFVLIGHSQGSLMLQLLIANEIENDPGRRRRG